VESGWNESESGGGGVVVVGRKGRERLEECCGGRGMKERSGWEEEGKERWRKWKERFGLEEVEGKKQRVGGVGCWWKEWSGWRKWRKGAGWKERSGLEWKERSGLEAV
jgi:hypothetical protein